MRREEARKHAQELVSQMTLEEKASQLKYDAPAIPRLGVPAYNWWNEALHGVARAGQATVFPQAIGLGATFDEELLKEIGDVIATEGRAKYNAYSKQGDRDIYKGLTFWSPNVNIFRDPRWGRGHETYGEDPYLTGRMGVNFVKGLQGEGPVMKAAACAKHFAVHSGPEELRHEFNAIASAKDMEETYLPAFETLVKEGEVEAVMGAYNRTNGEPCCGSETLIEETLRKKWGFEGHYVSDCGAIQDFHERHRITASPRESAAMALNAGCDVNCGNTYLHILSAYQDGLVTEEAITKAAVRLFTTRYVLGLFEETEYDNIPYEKVECREHLALSERAAAESFVLLKNDGILPLKKDGLHTIGVIGPNADSRLSLIGNYHGTATEYVTVLEGIRRYVGDDVRILYSVGAELFKDKTEALAHPYDRLSEAKIVAQHSDVVILCVGLDETLEGEEGDSNNSYASGDKLSLKLPDSQLALMEAVAETGKPVVLCLCAGSDIDLGYAAEHFNAVVQLWYPGAQGGKAVAKMLFGESAAFGKLPVTFYEALEELPEFTDYSMKGRTYRYMEGKAQYPFGYGLNYGKVVIKDAKLSDNGNSMNANSMNTNSSNLTNPENVQGDKQGDKIDESIDKITVTLENEGEFDAQEVVQVYVKYCNSSQSGLSEEKDDPTRLVIPNPQLCAFRRVLVKAKETVRTEIEISPKAFTLVDEEGNRFTPEGLCQLYVGFGQPDARTEELTGMKAVMLEKRLERMR